MSGELSTDPERQAALLRSLGALDILGAGAPCLRSERCCNDHPDWEVQTLGQPDPITAWVAELLATTGASVYSDPCQPLVRRVVQPSTGVYAEDVFESTPTPAGGAHGRFPGRRSLSAPRGVTLPADLDRMARHALDGESWRPHGGAPVSRRTQMELAATILRLTVERERVPRQVDVAAQPGYPDARRLRDILALRSVTGRPGGRLYLDGRTAGQLPWRMAYRLAALHAKLLDGGGTAGADDDAYLALSRSARDGVMAMLEKAGR